MNTDALDDLRSEDFIERSQWRAVRLAVIAREEQMERLQASVVDLWHRAEWRERRRNPPTLASYLGMTDAEYAQWISTPLQQQPAPKADTHG